MAQALAVAKPDAGRVLTQALIEAAARLGVGTTELKAIVGQNVTRGQVLATLGMLERFPMGDYRPDDIDRNGGRPDVMGVHLISEAERLAYADRDRYVADTAFVPLPGGTSDTPKKP